MVSAALVLLWLGALHLLDTRDYRVVGTGPEEYRRVFNATLLAFGTAAIVAYLLKMPVARGYLILAGPTGLLLLLLTRWMWRKWLSRKRHKAEYMHRAVVLGQGMKAQHVAHTISSDSDAGYQIVDIQTLASANLSEDSWNPQDFSALVDGIDAADADTLVLAGSDALTPRRLRELGWAMEDRDIELVIAPTLTDVAGPRIHMRPVAGIPLLHVDYPQLTRSASFVKRVFDVIGSAILIVVGSPVLLCVAAAVKLSSPGPVLFRQERIGLNGEPFTMLKFRSMVVDAEDRLPALLPHSDGNGVLFKMKDDPRVTRVGRVLRRYSLDELPQLLNVFTGDMSLVGPRPPLRREVEKYDESAKRRLLVKPGITGLWQVSGRSDLEWEDAIRLDLYYVENWSPMGDLVILYRTIRAVFESQGAY